MAMVRASYRRKGLIVCVVLAVLSTLTLSPALAENMPGKMRLSERVQFKARFSGVVVSVTPLPSFDNLLRFNLVTSGSVTDSNIPSILGASVVINEQILLNPEGNGLSIGGFTVSIIGIGEIRVLFTAKVTGVFYFKGSYVIVGGTGPFKRVGGYGTISGCAIPSSDSFFGATVYGTVDGYIWGLPLIRP